MIKWWDTHVECSNNHECKAYELGEANLLTDEHNCTFMQPFSKNNLTFQFGLRKVIKNKNKNIPYAVDQLQ